MPGVVTVACKVPNGLILRAFKMEPSQELVMGGGTREVMVARNVGDPIHIMGPGRLDRPGDRRPIASGYALTHNVDADCWEAWLAANQGSKLVTERQIFAHVKSNEASAIARENETRRTGLEALDPQGDPRNPKKRTQTRAGAVSAIESAPRQSAA